MNYLDLFRKLYFYKQISSLNASYIYFHTISFSTKAMIQSQFPYNFITVHEDKKYANKNSNLKSQKIF